MKQFVFFTLPVLIYSVFVFVSKVGNSVRCVMENCIALCKCGLVVGESPDRVDTSIGWLEDTNLPV